MFILSREGEGMYIRLQEYSSDYLNFHIKGKAKQTAVSAKVQSVLCDDAVCLNRKIVVWRSPSERSVEQLNRNCYCLCKRGTTNKAIVVVYIKLWAVAHRTVLTIKNFIKTKHKFILNIIKR